MTKENPICPFCKSDSIESLPSNNYLRKQWEKAGNSRMVTSGRNDYAILKGACLNCGMVFEFLTDDSIKAIHRQFPDK